jgi:6,7-dimethyl-8-ribityllumazine synthase
MKTNTFDDTLDGTNAQIAIVRARFNHDITSRLLDACVQTLTLHHVAQSAIRVIEVPGAFEISAVAATLANTKNYDAIITIGAIIKGETRHDEYIAHAVAQGITRASVETGVPIIFGVLTTNNREQADARSQGETNNGKSAALAALEMIAVFRSL